VSWLASALVQGAGLALPWRYRGDGGGQAVRRAPLLHPAQDLDRPRAVQPVGDDVYQAGVPTPPDARVPVAALTEQLPYPRPSGDGGGGVGVPVTTHAPGGTQGSGRAVAGVQIGKRHAVITFLARSGVRRAGH